MTEHIFFLSPWKLNEHRKHRTVPTDLYSITSGCMAEPSSQSRRGDSWVFWWKLNFCLAGKVLSPIIWPPQLNHCWNICPAHSSTTVRRGDTQHRSCLSWEKECSCTCEWRQRRRNGPRAVTPAKQQSGDVLSTQQLIARDEKDDLHTPYCMGQTCSKAQNIFSVAWRSLCIQWLLLRLLLPPQ